jgi:hypothetical protein
MKINKLRTFVVGLAVAAVAITQYGCEQEWQKQHDPAVLKAPATVELAVTSIEDSTAVVTYTQSVVGQLYVVVVPGDDETAAPEANSVLRLNAAGAVFAKQIFINEDAEKSGSISVTGLVQNTSYKVFALPVNTDGVLGEVTTTDAFATSDDYNPVLVSTSPAKSATADKAADFDVTVTFDEPVVINNEAGIYFRYLNIVTMEYTDVAAEVEVDGKKLMVVQPEDVEPIFGQYVFLTIEDDAIKDRAGNFYEGITSGIEGGYLVGLYWRIEYMPEAEDAEATLPVVGEPVQDLGFKVELTYDLPMAFYVSSGAIVYDSNDIIFEYATSNTTISVKVPSANVSFAGNVVTITPPRTPVYGETVTVKIAEGAYRTRYNSPNAEVELSWLISYGYTRDLVLGDYVIGNLVSQFDGPVATEYEVTLSAHATDPGLVVISGLLGSQDDIVAEFNGDFASFDIPVVDGWGQFLTFADGHPLAGYELEVWNGYTGYGGVAKGFILDDGTIEMFGLGFWYYSLTDPDDSGWYDLFSQSIWTKAAKSSVETNYVIKDRNIKGRIVN